jgi:exonuclease III
MKLISLNLEKDKHFDQHKDFLVAERPDVACFQEVFERDLEKYKELMDMAGYVFAPMALYESVLEPGKFCTQGIAIMTRQKMMHSQIYDMLPEMRAEKLVNMTLATSRDASLVQWKLISIDVKIGEKLYTIATTHAPVTDRGYEISSAQRQFFAEVTEILDARKQFILTGDMNSPRGYEVFDGLVQRFTDNIPQNYTTSIDNNIHRNGDKNLQYVIDALFTKGDYVVRNVHYQSGVSDHHAIVAEIS